MDTSKIIKGAVSSGRYTVTAPIVKEDYGLYLQIEGIELPSTYEVDFSNNENSGTSVTMIGNADGVLIPRQFIDSGKDVFAFLYHVGQDFGRTVYKFRIPNKLRPDRTEDTPTPEEQSVIDQTISALNTAVAQTAQDVIDADASAQSAQEYAEQAETARNTAQTYANNAQTSATQASASASQASTSATASAQSASQSAQIKADIEGMVDDAQSYAESALIASQASVTARDTAQGYAQSASASAQSASTSASNASTSAQTASTKATEASTSASTASQKATEASQSAENALSYKTDAESAKTASQTAQTASESARDSAIQAKTDAESAKADAESARDEAQQAVASISGALAEKAPIITDTASGAIASFSDGADDLPLKSLVVDINPVQDLSHGDPSPENICPISGWTEVNVKHSDADMTNPTTLTINLGQTVYGGKLDVLSGELVIDRAMVDLGTLNWTGEDNYLQGMARATVGVADLGAVYYQTPLCSTLKGTSPKSYSLVEMGTVCFSNSPSTPFMRVRSQIFSGLSDAEIKTALTGVQFVYELATPIEIQLTPNQVNSLLGANNIWADSGDTEVEYRADTKLYIAKKIAEAIASLT